MRWDQILRWIYPALCVICRAESDSPLCGQCTKVLSPDHERGNPSIRSAFLYKGHIRKLVHLVKFQRRRALGMYLGRVMGDQLTEWIDSIKPLDVIIPVPTTPRTSRHRSFNQAEVLARGFSEITGIPVVTHVLLRKRQQAHQYELTAEERKRNIQKAFCVYADRLAALPPQPRVLLMDDVYTTGATVQACIRSLHDSGINLHGIFAATLARVYNLR